MPFSHTLKASLVAMVLIALTAVPRLDAAPMENLEPWIREALDISKQAERPDLNQQAFGASSESAFLPVRSGEQLQGGPATPHPFGDQPWSTDGLPPWSTLSNPSGPSSPHPVFRPNADYPSGTARPSYGARGRYQGVSMVPTHRGWGGNGAYGHPNLDASHVTAVRNEVRQPSTSRGSRVTIALDAATRENTFGKTPLKEQPWSNDDILEILKGDQWRELRREKQAAFLNLFGEKVFTKDFYDGLPAIEGKPTWKRIYNHDLTQQLVEKYLKVRMDHTSPYPLRLDFKHDAPPPVRSFWTNFHKRFPKQPAWESYSAADEYGSLHPYEPFRLGIFSIKLVNVEVGFTGDMIRGNLDKHRLIPRVRVVARAGGDNKVYIGTAALTNELRN